MKLFFRQAPLEELLELKVGRDLLLLSLPADTTPSESSKSSPGVNESSAILPNAYLGERESSLSLVVVVASLLCAVARVS